jgi:hypothetical protein
MDDKQKKKTKTKGIYILRGIRNALICDGVAIVFLIVVASVYALIKNASIIKSIYMSFYYGGAVALLLAVPQFYKRNQNSKLQKSRRLNPMFGFYGWFSSGSGESDIMEGFEEFKGDGFWLGMMITLFGIVLLVLAVILENIFFLPYK